MALLEDTRWHGRIFNGEWISADGTLTCTEAATGETLGEVGKAGPAEPSVAADAAAAAGRESAARPCSDRAEALRRAADILEERACEAVGWIQREAGEVKAAAELELSLAVEEIRQAISPTGP